MHIASLSMLGTDIYSRDLRNGTATLLGAVTFESEAYATEHGYVPGIWVYIGRTRYARHSVVTRNEAIYIGLELLGEAA